MKISIFRTILYFGLVVSTFSIPSEPVKYTAKDLADKTNNEVFLYTPDFQPDSEDLAKLKVQANTIIDELKLYLKVYVVNNISDEYLVMSTGKKNIERFTNDLAFLINRNHENDKNSLLLVISINDRQMRIRSGNDVTNKVSSSSQANILKGVASYMRSKQYILAVEKILSDFVFEYKHGGTIFWTLVIVVLAVVGVVIACAVYKKKSQKEIDQRGIQRLEKLKNELKKNKPKKVFLDTTCVVCLDEFSEIELKEIDAAKPKDLQIVDGGDKSLTTLLCGHRFHDDCIKGWMGKENTCPTCRTKIDEEVSDEKFCERMVDIQAEYFPSIRLIDFTFLANDLMWNVPVASSGIDFNFNVFEGNSGGASFWDTVGGMAANVGGASADW